ncbi:tRNA glutamyl-Q(34) synthetase GluQRS [Nitrosospira briensis]|uniref:tRNA glutamyl-Q(34) synthetase GluQRS n=1 Tax=Nitrosospira briensis TaxID=35799 RepID=UPI00210B7823|nr:tRNA glutamyl-Q(34) synthetase GluQRS [Nitrosospira briensis]
MPISLPAGPIYRGRFAPSPTGPLHFGSLVAAVGSYLEARSNHGEWLVRIENLDPLREVPGASRVILKTLDALGMEWDGEVIYQNQRYNAYQTPLAILERQNLVYRCTCSRKEIADSAHRGIDGAVYPGTCRGRSSSEGYSGAWRLKTDNTLIEFNDAFQGPVRQHLENDSGDFVLRRADGIYAYQLAVVVDDAEQGVSHVVRGEDLLNSTPRQIYLQRLLHYPTPSYFHLPVVVNAQGEKLSKQNYAAPVNASDAVPQLTSAIRFLGQDPPAELRESDITSFWKWATKNWKPWMIPRTKVMKTS